MKRFLLCCAIILCAAPHARADKIVDFDELDTTGGFFDGFGAGASAGSWESQGVSFNTNQFGPGWSYTSVADNTTGGFANQYAAFTEFDFSGSGNYVVGTSFFGGAFFDLPTGHFAGSIRVTNATYPALSMLNGDAFAKRFGGPSGSEPDFFKVTFTGHSEHGAGGATTGSVDFFLADYRFPTSTDDYVVDTWDLVDLTSLGDARSIEVALESSDNGTFGMNTPAYFAIDELSLTSAPEPNGIAVLALIGITASIRRHRKLS